VKANHYLSKQTTTKSSEQHIKN